MDLDGKKLATSNLPFLNYSVRPSPNFLHTFKNFIFANVIVQPYYDKEFSKEDFLDGAKSAVEFVSNKIAEGEFEKLKESKALTEDCFRDVIDPLKNSMNSAQRHENNPQLKP
jgi:non-homologous end joining protein Ku